MYSCASFCSVILWFTKEESLTLSPVCTDSAADGSSCKLESTGWSKCSEMFCTLLAGSSVALWFSALEEESNLLAVMMVVGIASLRLVFSSGEEEWRV